MIDHAPLLERAFTVDPVEDAYTLHQVDGDVPSFVRGTYYLNGPARFANGPVRYRHWLDGDGMVCALRFDESGVHFASRYVKGDKWRVEHADAVARPVFRTFGTSFPQDALLRGVALASPVNVSVYPIGGDVLAFGEQGLPWRLDPVTLDTIGRFTFGGSINDVTPFSAHPKLDARDGALCNFGVSFSANHPCLHYYEFGDKTTLRARHRIPLEYASSMHDFALSPSFAAFYVSPYVLDMGSFVGGSGSVFDALHWTPDRRSRLLVIDRASGGVAASIPLSGDDARARYSLHAINSFEKDGYLHVDVIELARPLYDQYQPLPDLFVDVPLGSPTRFVIDCEKGELAGRQTIAYDDAPDFPSIDPRHAGRAYDDVWVLGISKAKLAGRKFFDELVHLSWASGGVAGRYRAPHGCYLGGEPVFIPGRAVDTGVVMCQELNAAESTMCFLVFDAFRVQRGPVARLWLDAPIHLGFHASYEAAPAA